jgi:hypothetical protein
VGGNHERRFARKPPGCVFGIGGFHPLHARRNELHRHCRACRIGVRAEAVARQLVQGVVDLERDTVGHSDGAGLRQEALRKVRRGEEAQERGSWVDRREHGSRLDDGPVAQAHPPHRTPFDLDGSHRATSQDSAPRVLDMLAKGLRKHPGASPGALHAGLVDQIVEEAHEGRTGGRRGETRRDGGHGEGQARLGRLEEPVDKLPATPGGNPQ